MESLTVLFKISDGDGGTGLDWPKTANHEAGHAVAHLVVPYASALKRVTILPEGTSAGHCLVDAAGEEAGPMHDFSNLICTLASMPAVHMHRNHGSLKNFSVKSYLNEHGFSKDIARAKFLAHLVSMDQTTDCKEEIFEKAGELARMYMYVYRDRVKLLADALIDKFTFDEAQVRMVTGLHKPDALVLKI